jgi:hypothetical protein
MAYRLISEGIARATRAYDIIETEKGPLYHSTFVDKRVYREELEKIFGLSWLWIGHEIIIPNSNDWKNSADSFIVDMHHAPLTHRSAELAWLIMRVRRNIPSSTQTCAGQPGSSQVSPGNGHGNRSQLRDEGETEEEYSAPAKRSVQS